MDEILTDNKGKFTINEQVLTNELTNTEANEQNEKTEYCFHHNQIYRQSSFFSHSNLTRLRWFGSNCNWVLSNIYFLSSQRTNEVLAFILYTRFPPIRVFER